MNANEDLLLEYIDKLLLKFPSNKPFDTEECIKELEVELNKVGDIQPLFDELINKLVELKYIGESEHYDSLSVFGEKVKAKGGHFKYKDFLIQEGNDRNKKAHKKGRLNRIYLIVGIIGVAVATLAIFYDRIFLIGK